MVLTRRASSRGRLLETEKAIDSEKKEEEKIDRKRRSVRGFSGRNGCFSKPKDVPCSSSQLSEGLIIYILICIFSSCMFFFCKHLISYSDCGYKQKRFSIKRNLYCLSKCELFFWQSIQRFVGFLGSFLLYSFLAQSSRYAQFISQFSRALLRSAHFKSPSIQFFLFRLSLTFLCLASPLLSQHMSLFGIKMFDIWSVVFCSLQRNMISDVRWALLQCHVNKLNFEYSAGNFR